MESFHYAPPVGPIQHLHLDKDVLVVHKPSGLLSVPGREAHLHDSMYSRVLLEFPLAQVVHRLDMDTSGVMLFALRRKAESELKRQFRERLVTKVYEARVWGRVAQERGVMTDPLAHDLEDKPKSKVCVEQGKPAHTEFEVIETDATTTRLRLFPKTGRSHQLRVHCLALGHPILGDRFYAEGEALAAAARLQLQAVELTFLHPYRGEPIQVTCPLDF